jgi:hypothetical protein
MTYQVLTGIVNANPDPYNLLVSSALMKEKILLINYEHLLLEVNTFSLPFITVNKLMCTQEIPAHGCISLLRHGLLKKTHL